MLFLSAIWLYKRLTYHCSLVVVAQNSHAGLTLKINKQWLVCVCGVCSVADTGADRQLV